MDPLSGRSPSSSSFEQFNERSNSVSIPLNNEINDLKSDLDKENSYDFD